MTPAALLGLAVALLGVAVVLAAQTTPAVARRRLADAGLSRSGRGPEQQPGSVHRRTSRVRRPPPASPLAAALAAALAADLLSAALLAGSPLAAAFTAVGDALISDSGASSSGRERPAADVGRLLRSVGRGLLLGATLEHALDPLHVPRTDRSRGSSRGRREPAPLTRLAAVVTRSAASGARLAEQLGLLADDLRAETAAAGLAGARRLGVLAVLPLGGCFLPAFMLLAVVPTVAGLVDVVAG